MTPSPSRLVRIFIAGLAVLVFHPGAFAQEKAKHYETLTTIHGTVYEKVDILLEDPHGVTFRHTKGIAKIPFAELSKAFRDLFGYEKEKAREFLRDHAPKKPAPKKVRVRVYRHVKTKVEAPRLVSPAWVYPAPLYTGYNPVLWRHAQLCNHLHYSGVARIRALRGFEDVAGRVRYPHRVGPAHTWPAPAIGYGRSVPAIGATLRQW